jgi:hypothetical protein
VTAGFIMQMVLVPRYINLLSNGLFQQFRNDDKVDGVNALGLIVGVKGIHAVAAHF